MIKMEFLHDCKGANKFGTCAGCGRRSEDDMTMVRIRFCNDIAGIQQGSSICLCRNCLSELKHRLSSLTVTGNYMPNGQNL